MAEMHKPPAVQAAAPVSDTASILAVIDRATRDPSADVEKMQKLFDLYERIEARKAEQAFSDSMCSAQEDMRPISKDASNPQTHSKYASYGALDNALRPIYSKNGFALSFDSEHIETKEGPAIKVTCKVSHKNGHIDRPTLTIPIVTKGPQGKDVMTLTHATMSAISYGRRGLLKMVFNIAEGEFDDDGNGSRRRQFDGPIGNITQEQHDELLKLITENNFDLPEVLAWLKIERLPDLPAGMFNKAKNGLAGKIQNTKQPKHDAETGEAR